MGLFLSGRPVTGRAGSLISRTASATLRRFYLVVLVAALTLPAHAWAQAVCANPGSNGGGTISGIVNTYFQGNGNLAAGATTLTLGKIDSRGSAVTLVMGDLLLIMQMQDGDINSTNTSSYGDGSGSGSGTTSAGNAGLHEFVTVTAAATGTTGDAITFTPALTNTYKQVAATTTSGQKRYQVIRVPQYTSATAAGITAPGWGFGTGATGETGGVAAVDVRDTLTLGSATVEGQTNRAFFLGGKGFRGAAGDGSAASNGSNADWVSLASSTSPPTAPAFLAHGGKGEGIAGTPRFFAVKDQWGFQTTNAVTAPANLVQIDYGISGVYAAGIEGYPNGAHARGAPGNAGGGGTDGRNPDAGNDENAGGGGGGSFAAGGLGGRPWNAPLVDSDGRGGAGYSATLAFNRVFMGGGGGSGGTNNATADPAAYTNQAIGCNQAALCSSGGGGGGIVIIRARAVTGTGIIDVRGAHAYNVLNDAAGGGGGGGAVVVYSVDGGNASVNAAGGDGGNAWAGNQSGAGNRHGPGGGGGGGFVAYSPQGMSVNATLDGGTPGITTNGTDTYSSSGNIGGLSTFQTPTTPGTVPGALCVPDLHMTKSDGVSSVTPGQALNYTLTVGNAASAPTIGTITVVDVMPATLIYSGTPTFVSGNFTCAYAIGPPQSFSCTSTTAIAANGSNTITIPVTVSPTALPGSITNQAQVGGGGDPNKTTPTIGTTQTCTANDTPAGCAVDVDALQSPLLSVAKTDSTDVVLAGGTTSYSLTVSNTGGAATIGTIQLVDVLPTGLVYPGPATFASGIFNCTFAAPNFTCTTATSIAIGGSSIITIPVSVSTTAPGAVTNLAQVGGGGDPGKTILPTPGTAGACPNPDPPATTSSDPASGCAGDTDAVQHVNLTMTKDDGAPSLLVGGSTTYTYSITNGGDAASVGTIFFRDELPAGLTFPATLVVGGTNGADWTCTRVSATSATCTSTTAIASGATSKFTLLVSAAGATNGTQYLNKSRIAGGGDSDLLPGPLTPANVTACISNNNPAGCALDLDTATQAIIRLAKTHTGASFNPGATVPFTLAVSNSGGLPSGGAGTVTVIDVLPTSLTYTGAATFTSGLFNCTVAANVITCTNTAAIAAGITSNITFSAIISATASNSIVNPAKVGTTGGFDPSNNTAPTPATAGACTGTNAPTVGCATDTVALNADLQITKTDGATTYAPGASVTYTITATNAGPAGVVGAVVADTVPAALSGVTWTATYTGGGTGPANGSGNINATVNLPSAATAIFTVTGTTSASATANLVNTATVTAPAGITDTNPANNTATDTDTAAAVVDLAISKSDGVTTATPGGGVTYTISVTNSGPSNAVGATVTDSFPAAFTGTWTCAATGGAACTGSGSGNINDTVNVPVGASVTYTVTGTINAAATGTLSNTATVTAPVGVTDSNPGNNSSTDTDTLTPSANLAIAKTDGVSSANAGGTVTYTITATNLGPSNAPGATVSDTLPAAITSDTWTCASASGGTCTASGSGNISDTVNLPVGGSVVYTVTAHISMSATGSLSNTATVTSPAGVPDPTPANNSATDTDTITQSADLSITKNDGVTSATPGGSVTYTIVASNAGPSNATGATVTDTFPASITATWTCVGAGGGTCTASGSGNINATVNLPSGGSVTYTVIANISATATGSLTNTATVTAPAGVTDPTPGNNSATDTDTLSATADLSITKTDGVTTATPGGSVTYTITASNAGPSAANGATVTDTFPASLTATWTCVGASGGTCTASGSGNINDTVNLPSGASVIYTVSATISASASGTLSNTATVTAPAGVTDPTPANNSATDTDTLKGNADLSITKTDGVATATAGNTVTYTITASNAGPSNVTGATIADTLPAAIVGATWTCTGAGGGTCTATGSGNINDTVNLPSGSSVIYTVTAPINSNATGTLSNTATVTAPAAVTDPTPANNSATDTDTLNASADTSITKSDGSATYTPGGTAVYTIVASNAGPSDVTGATVSDPLPTGITTAAWTCIASSGSSCAASGSGAINDATVHLVKGGTATYTLTLTIPSGFTGNLVNTASIANPTGVTDPTPGNNSATDTDTPNASADTSITKTDGSPTYTPGGTAVYTIVATNAGPADVTGATVADALPSGITTASWTCVASAGSSCAASGSGSINDATVHLIKGGTATYTLTLTIPASFTGSLVNTATIANPTGVSDPTPANNTATDTDTLKSTADLSITKTDGVTTATAGNTVTYTITASNAGPSNVTGATVSDTFPAAISGATWTCTGTGGGTCTATGSGNIADTVNLPSGASVIYTVTAPINSNATGTLSNTATITAPAGVTDPTPANNSATDTDTLNASADTSITKSDGSATYTPGGTAVYTIVASNAGPSDVTGATVSDPLPTGITTATWTCVASPGSSCAASGSGAINDATVHLLKNGAATYTLTLTIPSSFTGNLVNTASIANPAGVTDPTPGNNSATDTDTLSASADLSITKTDNSGTYTPGSSSVYTIVATNNGPSDVLGATVSDPLPAGITTATWTCAASSGSSCTASGSGAINDAAVNLKSGGTATYTLSLAVPSNFMASLVNTATVTNPAGVTDPVPTNNTATDTDTLSAFADIALAKIVDNATPNVGDNVTFTITATNNGPSDATGVAATDALPSGFTYVSSSAAPGTSYDSSTGVWTIGALDNGASLTLTITATVEQPGSLTNTVSVTASDQTDPDTSNNTAGSSINGNPSADVQVNKSVDNAAPNVGNQVTFTINAKNAGPDDATGVQITDLLPAGLTYVSSTISQGTYASGTGIWNVGGILNGATQTLTITATVTQAGTILNLATKTAENENDPVPTNNQSGATLNGQEADIQVVKTVDNADPNVGDTVVFTVTTTNLGPSPATGVQVTDVLPAGLTLTSAVPSAGTYNTTSGVWNIGNLDASGAGAVVTLTITAKVAQPGSITNTATVTAEDQTDPNTTNNTSSSSLSGTPSADLVVTKSGPASATAGNTVTYTVTIVNNGPSDAAAVSVADTTPTGLTFVSNTGDCTTAYPCALGTIVNGDTRTITSTYSVPSNYTTPTTITNTATATSTTPDPNTANNTGTTSANLGAAVANLSIVKSGTATVMVGGTITYSLLISNAGPSSADGSTFSDTLPAGLTFVSVSCGTASGGAACGPAANSGGTVSGTVSTLPPSGSVTITIVATAPNAATTVTNTATVTPPAGTTDSDPSDNTSSTDTTVSAAPAMADLRVTKTGTATAHPGQTVTYTITVHNNGGSDATNVIVADPTPAGLTFVANSGACSAAYPCNIGTLLNGGTATITSTYTVNAGFTGPVLNTASVSSDVPDPTPNNNSSSTPTSVTPGGGPPPPMTAVPIDARWMLLAMIGLLAGVGLRRSRVKR